MSETYWEPSPETRRKIKFAFDYILPLVTVMGVYTFAFSAHKRAPPKPPRIPCTEMREEIMGNNTRCRMKECSNEFRDLLSENTSIYIQLCTKK